MKGEAALAADLSSRLIFKHLKQICQEKNRKLNDLLDALEFNQVPQSLTQPRYLTLKTAPLKDLITDLWEAANIDSHQRSG